MGDGETRTAALRAEDPAVLGTPLKMEMLEGGRPRQRPHR